MSDNAICVVIDTANPEDIATGFELLTPGRSLADSAKVPLAAVVLGCSAEETAQTAVTLGADLAYLCDHPRFAEYDTDSRCHVLASLIREHDPSVLLIPATDQGRDLAPRLACRFRTGLTADCTEIALQPDRKTVAWTRPALGGNLMATILCQKTRPQMGTIRPGVFAAPAADPKRAGMVHILRNFGDLPPARVQLLSALQNVFPEISTGNADIIVAGGLGMGSKENFRWIHRLAAVLGGSVGASRGAVREGWAPYSCQIGQSGRTVRPEIYIACGISGAIQHLAGIAAAECVIAINADPQAPIFDAAHYGIVGDVVQILPELIALLEDNPQ